MKQKDRGPPRPKIDPIHFTYSDVTPSQDGLPRGYELADLPKPKPDDSYIAQVAWDHTDNNLVPADALTAMDLRRLAKRSRDKYIDIANQTVIPMIEQRLRAMVESAHNNEYIRFVMPVVLGVSGSVQKRELRQATVACLKGRGFTVEQDEEQKDVLHIWFSEFTPVPLPPAPNPHSMEKWKQRHWK